MTHRFQVVPAAYVILRRDAQVLLQLRRGTGYRDGHWACGAAGHVEAGETVLDAAVREAGEEAGIDVHPADLRPLTTLHRTHRNGRPVDERVDFFFTCERWGGEPRLVERRDAGREVGDQRKPVGVRLVVAHLNAEPGRRWMGEGEHDQVATDGRFEQSVSG